MEEDRFHKTREECYIFSMTKRFGTGFVYLIAGGMLAAGWTITPAHADGLMNIQGLPGLNCTCRYRGQDFQLGDRVCLNSPDGPQQAECGFVLNNTSWNFTGLSCVYSNRAAPGRLAALPVLNMSPVPHTLLQ